MKSACSLLLAGAVFASFVFGVRAEDKDVISGSSLVKVAPEKARIAGGLRAIQTPARSCLGAGLLAAAGGVF